MMGAMRRLLRKSIGGFQFWTLFHGLGPMVWYYPMNELEISGYEVFVLVWLVPIFLEISVLRRALQTQFGDAILQVGIIGGLLSFQSPTTFLRLCMLTGGVGFAMLKFSADLSNKENKFVRESIWGYLIGYLLLLTTRILWRTISPTWSDDLSNRAVVTVALLTLADQLLHSTPVQDVPTVKVPIKPLKPHWFPLALGLGSLIFATQWQFGEVSVLARWSVAEYPNPGPNPNPWGLLVFGCLAAGLSVLSQFQRLVFNPVWMLLLSGGLPVSYWCSGHCGFLGGLLTSATLMATWPHLLALLHHSRVGLTVTVAMLTYLFEIFFSVWTVAYNFVPGGEFTRELSSFLIVMVALTISFALWSHRNLELLAVDNHVAFNDMNMSNVFKLVGLLTLISAGGMGERYYRWTPGEVIYPPAENPRQFTAMMWTYHFGYDNQAWPSLEKTVKLISNIQADVIGLVETDASKPYMGSNDLTQWLAERLNMYADFGPATKTHTWGSVLLSRYPIISSQHHLLPSPEGELAPAISAVLNISGQPTGVVVVHMGNDKDDLDRRLQAQYLSNITSTWYNKGIPTVFLGYVTSAPGSRDYQHFIKAGKLTDIDETDRERWCEYIFYSRLVRLAYARISHAGLTDTEVQVAKFQIPDNLKNYEDNKRTTIDPSSVPANIRFNPAFGDYYPGHFYRPEHHFHMSTPKYFLSQP